MIDDDSKQFPTAAHEPNAVNASAIWWSALALIAVVIIASLLNEVLIQVFQWPNERAATSSAAKTQTVPTPAGPQLDPDQSATLAKLRSTEQQRLGEYAWVNEQAGVARIPIERAMAIAAEKRLPPAAARPADRRDVVR
jgi:hypothetical protein